MIQAVLFDLDDTLYPEMQFVQGGLRAVADFLEQKQGLAAQSTLTEIQQFLKQDGRGKLFDRLLAAHKLPAEWVPVLIWIYRSHPPQLHFFDDVVPAITALRQTGMQLGVITDGLASVQYRKAEALKLSSHVDLILCTDELGPHLGKPSRVPFEAALTRLGREPEEAVYVGDNPRKDFFGANQVGLRTIHLRRDGLSRLEGPLTTGYAAHHDIKTLAELQDVLRDVLKEPV